MKQTRTMTNEEIRERRRNGESYGSIGRAAGIKANRVATICNRDSDKESRGPDLKKGRVKA